MFHNIFSNKKTKPIIKNRIIIDNREKQSLVPSELAKLGFEIHFQQLQLGDYILNGTIIERKSFQDLQSSIIDRRIFSQIQDLKKTNSLLIIEISGEKRLHPNAIRGFLLSLTQDYQIPYIISENEKETAKYISILSNKDKNSNLSIRQTRSNLSIEEQKQFILEGFPGIGPVSAKKLLEKYKSLSSIFNADKKEIEEILGKKADIFFKTLSE